MKGRTGGEKFWRALDVRTFSFHPFPTAVNSWERRKKREKKIEVKDPH